MANLLQSWNSLNLNSRCGGGGAPLPIIKVHLTARRTQQRSRQSALFRTGDGSIVAVHSRRDSRCKAVARQKFQAVQLAEMIGEPYWITRISTLNGLIFTNTIFCKKKQQPPGEQSTNSWGKTREPNWIETGWIFAQSCVFQAIYLPDWNTLFQPEN